MRNAMRAAAGWVRTITVRKAVILTVVLVVPGGLVLGPVVARVWKV